MGPLVSIWFPYTDIWKNIEQLILKPGKHQYYAAVSRNLFHEWLMNTKFKSCKNISWSCMKTNHQIMPQFCTCHNSSAVVACANLWHDWVIKIKIRVKNTPQDYNDKLLNVLWDVSWFNWHQVTFLQWSVQFMTSGPWQATGPKVWNSLKHDCFSVAFWGTQLSQW